MKATTLQGILITAFLSLCIVACSSLTPAQVQQLSSAVPAKYQSYASALTNLPIGTNAP